MKHTLFIVSLAALTACTGNMGGLPEHDASTVGDAAAPPRADAGVPTADAGPQPDTDAGPTGDDDGGAPDLDAGALPGEACPAGVLFCDDFESGALDGDAWATELREAARITVSDERAFEGSRAMRLEMPAIAGGRAYARPQGVVPVEGNRFYGRFYLLATPTVDMVHSAVLEARGTLDGGRTIYGLHSNQARLNSRYQSPVIEEHGGLRKIGEHRLPSEWTCVELLFDGERDEIRFWFDGIEDEAMRVTPSTDPEWVAPEFEELVIGFLTYQAASAAFEIWYDAVAFDTERIGCIGE